MSFTKNEFQQINLLDNFNAVSERTKKFLRNSYPEGFATIVFPAINEDRFSVLYNSYSATRPNTKVCVNLLDSYRIQN